MERWAANTLRTLGIIFTGCFVLVTSLLLALLSLCAAQGGFSGDKHPEQVVPYAAAALFVLALGIFVIARLARGIFRSMATTPAPAGASLAGSTLPVPSIPEPAMPLHLSPSGKQAIDRLVLAMAAQIALSAGAWIFNQLHFWTAPRALAPHNWILLLLAPFLLYHIPYAILIYLLLKRPDRRAFAFALAVPPVLILQALFSLSVVGYYYIQHPLGFVFLFVPWLLHIVIIVLAYKAIQQVGVHPEPPSLIVAALAAFFYFSFIHAATPFLYRFTWR